MYQEKTKRIQVMISEPQIDFLDRTAEKMEISRSALFRKIIDDFQKEYKEQQLRQIAESLYDEYATNEELTSFTDLDGEDFA